MNPEQVADREVGLDHRLIELKGRDVRVHTTIGSLDHRSGGERVPLKGKGLAVRKVVPLTPALIDALRDHRARRSNLEWAGAGDWVFAQEDGRPVTAERFGSAFHDAAKAAGLGPDPNLVPHSLRHGYGSHLLRAGVDVVTVSKRMGHAPVDITLRVCAHEGR
jgi:integrase